MAVNNLGTVKPGTTLYLPFHTFDSNDPSASTTLTGLATTDIEIYKDGAATTRASDSGYALLDTDGIDFATTTGIHGISVDLSDNTTAGFYAAGHQYWVVIASVTVDAATINFVLATFRIGYPGALLDTTINVYTSTDNFTLNEGSADDDAYNGCILVAHDVASAIQTQIGVIEDYTGSTKTVNLKADPGVFTMTAADHISILPPALLPTTAGTTLDVTATGAAGIDWANIENPTTAVDLSGTDIQLVDTTTTNTDMRGTDSAALASVATEARLAELDAANLPADVDSILADTGTDGVVLAAGAVDAIWDETMTAHVTADSAAVHLKDTLADTADMQPKLGTPAGADMSADIAQIDTVVDGIQTDLDNGTDGLGALLTAIQVISTTARTEPGTGAPGVSVSALTKIDYLYKAWRNRVTQTATTYTLYNDDTTTAGQTAAVSDDTTTFDKGEVG